ncbi:putative ras [Phialemonium atrogriseum]|uniref:Ras n=1 Tax=Phialemonium atrogriseum TaxID=1093897 RepID=A0AAJ0C8E3_9PEZI|nr:putative ras [Phialemonium atrogriseum]KAK1771871.1 putative ras [Phialemonium atrogriseum]
MSTPSPARMRSIYRSFLRELPPRPILSTPPSPIHQRLRDSFRTTPGPASASASPAPDAAAQAEQFLAYVQAQRAYTGLLERYNPGMGMDEEERVRLSARRVGVNLPKEYVEGEDEGGPPEGKKKE